MKTQITASYLKMAQTIWQFFVFCPNLNSVSCPNTWLMEPQCKFRVMIDVDHSFECYAIRGLFDNVKFFKELI